MNDTRVLVFATQRDAADASATITRNIGFSGSTFLFAQPAELADATWCIPHPTDDAWMRDVGAHQVGTGLGQVALGIVVTLVPASVTNFQARAVLMQMASPTGVQGRTLFDDVNDTLKAEGGVSWQAWEQANDFTRNGTLVMSLGERLGLSPAQLDGLFTAAAGVSA